MFEDLILRDAPLEGIENDRFLYATFWMEKSLHLYATGYRQAAESVIRDVVERGIHRDTMIYPFVFLWRQHIELMLKLIIMGSKRVLSEEGSFKTTHKIDELWPEARSLLVEVIGDDVSLPEIDEVISELARIDPDSFFFRYPMTKSGDPTVRVEAKHWEGEKHGMHWGRFHKRLSDVADLLDGAYTQIVEIDRHSMY